MRNLVVWLCVGVLSASAAFADSEPAPVAPSKWTLASDQTYTILLANMSAGDITYIYRICQGDGPATRVATSVVSGQPVILGAGACVDVATQGSVRLTRADATGTNLSSGTYQFIYAFQSFHGAPARSS